MSMLTLETAWRNYRGAARDQAAAEEKLKGSRQAWAHTLLEQMAERYETAREELGLDVTKEKVLLQIGVPCVNCLRVVYGRRDGHGLFVGGADSAAPAYAECDGQPVDPAETPMPAWPTLPKAATA